MRSSFKTVLNLSVEICEKLIKNLYKETLLFLSFLDLLETMNSLRNAWLLLKSFLKKGEYTFHGVIQTKLFHYQVKFCGMKFICILNKGRAVEYPSNSKWIRLSYHMLSKYIMQPFHAENKHKKLIPFVIYHFLIKKVTKIWRATLIVH